RRRGGLRPRDLERELPGQLPGAGRAGRHPERVAAALHGIPLFSETVPRHREAVGDRPVVQTPHELAVPGRDRDGDVMRRARYQPGGKVLRLRSELGLLLHLKEHGLGLLPRLPEHAGHLRREDDLARPIARVGGRDLAERGEGGVPTVSEQLARAEVRQRLESLRGGECVPHGAGEATAQDGGGLVVVETLVRAHPLREQVGGRLLGGDFASHREHEQRGQEQLNKAACHGASSRRTMSVILRRWPDPISNRRSYGWKPSRSTRSACVPGWMGTSISGTVPTSCPSTYALPHGIALMDTCPSSIRRATVAGGAAGACGGASFVAPRRAGGTARWTRGAAGRATRGAGAAGSRSGCTLAGGGALAGGGGSGTDATGEGAGRPM